MNPRYLARYANLFKKNKLIILSSRRLSEAELSNWVREGNRKLWTFRVSDKFGDSGLTGIASIEITNDKTQIIDFILSCRVMGRKVEEAMLFTLIKDVQSKGIEEIYAKYLPTAKNKPCLRFFESSVFKKIDDFLFKLDVNQQISEPPNIQIQYSPK